MFDNTCKFLAENFPRDFANWLLGEDISLTKIEPSELSLEPIRADSVIFLESSQAILHLEFQTEPRANIPLRMTDYYLRLYRKFSQLPIHQFVIYLLPTQSPRVLQTRFETPNLTHQFNVIRLWEQPTELFQSSLGLLPLAVLTQTPDSVQTIRQVAQIIETLSDHQLQSNLAAATALMAGLKLDQSIIQTLFRSEIMKESVIYQEILREGEIKGEIKGKVEGKVEERLAIARNLLNLGLSENLIAQATGLSPEAIRELT